MRENVNSTQRTTGKKRSTEQAESPAVEGVAGSSGHDKQSKGSLDTAEAQTSRRKISQKKLPRRKWSKTEIENENAE